MAVALPLTEVLDADQIVQLALDRQAQYRLRDALYDKFLSYYFDGESVHPASSYTPPVLAMDSKGRPLLRPFEVGSSIESKRGYNSKRLAPIVDDYQSLKGRMPSTRVVPPSAANGEEKADLLTKYLYSTYEMSDMLRQQVTAGFWMSLLGDALYMLEPANGDFSAKHPDPKGWRVVWTVYSPRFAYPTFYRGFRRFQIFDVVLIQEWSAWDINHSFRDYGIRVPEDSPPEERCVITYLSPYQRTIVVGQQYARRGPHNEWDLGFCPAAWAYNKTPGEMGMADIAHSLDQQDFLDFLMSVMADGIVHMTYPIVGLKGSLGDFGTEQLMRGPDAPPVPLDQEGDIIVRSTQGDIKAALAMVDHATQDITAGTGSSSVRQTGEMKSSIVTGRAVHATQGPQSTRIDTWQQSMTAVIQRLNSMTLEMQERAPYLKAFEGDVFGSHHGRSFQVRFNAVQDIDGWYRNTVRWEGLVGMNDQQKISIAYEGLAAKLWDRPYARELAGVDDPLGMDARIEQDLLTDARIQSDVQKIMEGGQNPQGGGTPSPAPASGGGSPAPRGGHNAGPSPQALFRPPNLGRLQGGGWAMNPGQAPNQSSLPPAGGASPQGGAPSPIPKMGLDRDSIRQALIGIAATLKGNVYAIDDLAFEGRTQQPVVAVTDFRDQTKVTNALRQIAPNIKVQVIKGDKIPLEATRLV